MEKAKALVLRELNFYRVHVLAFTFVSSPSREPSREDKEIWKKLEIDADIGEIRSH